MYLRLTGLCKAFGEKPVVRDLSLTLEKGQILCLLGPSGCGKTTTLRMIGGLLRPDAGTIEIDGEDITHLPPERRPVTTVFQSYALFPHMTVLQNVTYGLKLRKIPPQEARSLAMEYLEIAGLTEYAGARISEVSGGQQQRVALMRSLVLQPKVLLLDEPLSNLDAKLRERMRSEIVELRDRLGLTMVFVTHDQEEAMVIADQVAVMHEGRILQMGGPQQLYHQPADEYVMRFFGAASTLTLDGKAVHVRPEDIRLDEAGPIEGVVAGGSFHGFYRRYLVDTALGQVAVVCSKERIYQTGQTVHLAINPKDRLLKS